MTSIDNNVTLAAQGDQEAFARLIETYKNSVCSIALAIARNLEDSEEIAQEAFLAAWQNIGKLRNPESFAPWLRELTRNAAKSSLRGDIRRRKRIAAADDPRVIYEAPGDESDSRTALLLDEEAALISEAIDALPEASRETVTLFYREGRSVAQVASLLEISEDAVKQRLSRARSCLRDDLAARFGEVLERTVPGGAFTAAVIGLLTMAPKSAAAATAVASAVAGSSKAAATGGKAIPIGGKVAAGGLAAGLAGGVGGLLLGFWATYRRARDDTERRGLRRVFYVSLAMTIIFPLSFLFVHNAAGRALVLGVFMGGMGLTQLVWIPKIIARRQQAECEEDPKAARRHKIFFRLGLAGLIVGTLAGGGSLLYAWLTSGSD